MIGGSLLTFQLLLALVLMRGRLMLLVQRFVSLSGLLVGWTLRIGLPRRLYVLSRMSGRCMERSSGLHLLMWYLLFEMLFRAYCRAGGSTEAGSTAFLG